MACPVDMATPKNILLIRLKSIGDILFTLPAVHTVRENFPGAKITFLASHENAPLLRGFREVNNVIAIDRAQLRNPFRAAPEFFRLLRSLRAEKFSLAVDFQGYGETAWLSWWTGAPERWGSVYVAGREWLYTRGAWRSHKIHPAEWNLSLLRQGGLRTGKIRNEFVLPADALEKARRFFQTNKLDEYKTTLFIQPFTSSPQKNWPLENFLKLGWHWRSRGVQVLFGGGVSERDALEPARAAGFPITAGAPLLVSAGLTKLSTLTIGGDTGLLHLAVAMGKRVVMLMRSIVPGSTHPFQHADWAVTPPAGKTVSEIQFNIVIEACAGVFSERAGNASC